MKYLFIVTESESANGICAKAVMERLLPEHEVFCITNREYGAPKENNCDGIHFRTVRPRLHYRILSRLTHSPGLSSGKQKLIKLLAAGISNFKLLLTMSIWPWNAPLYTNRIYRCAKKLCKQQKINCIVPIYTQIDTLIAANRIKKKNSHIRYVPYFLDALSGGYGLRFFSPEKTIRKGLRWERRLLSNADDIIVMESSREHHQKYSCKEAYFSRIHYYDIPLLLPPTSLPTDSAPLMDPKKINLVYVGTLPSGIRSPSYLLRVFQELKGEQWQLYFVGTADCQELNAAESTDSRIHVIGRVPHKIALAYESQGSILVNLGNTNPRMTPCKIFEYMSFGKPIVSTAPIPEEPGSRYLQHYPASLILDTTLSEKQAAAQLLSFAEEFAGGHVDANLIRERFQANTPDAVSALLQGKKE